MCILKIFRGCYGNGRQKLVKNREKMLIFVICVIFKCDLPPINTPQGIGLFSKSFLALVLINSCQLNMTKKIGSEVQSIENDDTANAKSINNIA